jgi:hypothetical protein
MFSSIVASWSVPLDPEVLPNSIGRVVVRDSLINTVLDDLDPS